MRARASRRRSLKMVLFDVGGTLLHVEPSVEVVYAETAARHGFEAEPAVIRKNFKEAWKRSLERSRARGYRCSDETLRAEWLEIVRDSLAAAVPTTHIDAIFKDLYERFASGDAWRLAPGAREGIRHLRHLGVRLGIVSNWDRRLRRMLAELEIGSAFEFVVASHEVGYEKPHLEIFREGLRLANRRPEEILHVGDSLEADILPARQLGVRTLWVAPQAERELAPEAGPGVEALPEVPSPFWDVLLEAG